MMAFRQHRMGVAAALLAGLAAPSVGQIDQMAPEVADAEVRRAKQMLMEDPGLAHAPGQMIVKFRDADLGVMAMRAVSARVIRPLDSRGTLHVATTLPVDQAVDLMRQLPFVEFAEPDYVVRHEAIPNDTYFYLQWGADNTGQNIRGVNGVFDVDIDAAEAWDTFTGDSSFVIAVIDSGVQWSHPDLDDNIWSNAGEIPGNGVDDDGNGYVDDTRGWDFYDGDSNPDDPVDGHGTHVAGTIGAEGNNGQGVAGMLWDAQIMPLRFLGANGGFTSDAVLAVNYAVNNGATISNNSWGGGGFSTALYNAINNARANDHIFVAAAGNGGSDFIGDNTDASPHYPSSYNLDNIISVASIDNRGNRASSSNYGAASVDIGAPGVDIASTYIGSSYVWNSGTSMASPHVAGVAAAVRILNPGWSYAQVIDQVFQTASPSSALDGITVTGGVVNMNDAIGSGTPPTNTPPTVSILSPASGLTVTEGDPVSFSGSATDAEDGNLNASLVWSSSRDGQIGSGASFTTSTLSVGVHVISATASDSGNLSDSDSITLTVESSDPPADTPPATPGRPSLSNLGGGSVQITWADNSDNEDQFEVQRERRSGRSWTDRTTIATVGANVTQHVDSPGNGRWRYRVHATNSAGSSGWSSWRTIRIR